MKRKPRSSNAPIMGNRTGSQAVFAGLVMALATLLLESWVFSQTSDATLAATIALTTFSLGVIFVGLSSRSETRTVFSLDTLADPGFLWKSGIAIVAAILVTVVPFLQRWFETTSLNWQQWLLCLLFGSAVLWFMEILKFINRRQARKSEQNEV